MTIILTSDFEEGDLSEWDGYDGSFTASTTQAHNGTYSGRAYIAANANNAWAGVYKGLSGNLFFIRGYIYIDPSDLPPTDEDQWYLAFTQTSAGSAVAYAGIRNNSGTLVWSLWCLESGSLVRTDSALAAPTEAGWHYVELAVLRSSTVGYTKLWVDSYDTENNPVISRTGLNNTARTIGYARAGFSYSDASTSSAYLYVDDVVISDEFNGPISSVTTNSLTKDGVARGKKNLSMRVPPVVDFDSGFETGDRSEWTSSGVTTGSTLTVETSPVHHGKYVQKSTCPGTSQYESAYSRKIVTAVDEGYLAGYIYVDSHTIAKSGDKLVFFRISGTTNFATVGWHYTTETANNVRWILQAYDDDLTYPTDYYSGLVCETGRWYFVELFYKNGAIGTASIRLYVEGVLAASISNRAFTDQIADIRAGIIEKNSSTTPIITAQVYTDCISFDGTYISRDEMNADARGIKVLSTTSSGLARGVLTKSVTSNGTAKGILGVQSLTKDGTARGIKTGSLQKLSVVTSTEIFRDDFENGLVPNFKVGISGYINSQSALENTIYPKIQEYGMNLYRVSFRPSYITDEGDTHLYNEAHKDYIRWLLNNTNLTIIVDANHLYPPNSTESNEAVSNWSAIEARCLEVCADFPNNPRVWVEIINEFVLDDSSAHRLRELVNTIRNAGYTNPLVYCKWGDEVGQTWAWMQEDFSLTNCPNREPFYTGMHFYFDTWSPSGADTQIGYANGRGFYKTVNTEIGAHNLDSGSYTQDLVNEVRDFLELQRQRNTVAGREAHNCMWQGSDLSNWHAYENYNLTFTPSAPWNRVDESNGTISIVSNIKHHNTYSAKSALTAVSGAYARVEKDTPRELTELYVRAYIRTDALPAVGQSIDVGPAIYAADGTMLAKAQITNPYGIGRLQLAYWDGTTTQLIVNSNIYIYPNTWYPLEIRVRIGSGDGIAELRIYESLICSASSLTNNSAGNITKFSIGGRSSAALAVNIYCDCVVASTSSSTDETGGVTERSLTKNSAARGVKNLSLPDINSVARGKKTLSLTKDGLARALKTSSITKNSISRGIKNLSLTKNGTANGYWPTSTSSITKDGIARGIKTLSLTKSSESRGIKNLSLTKNAIARGKDTLLLSKDSIARGKKLLALTKDATARGRILDSLTIDGVARGIKTGTLMSGCKMWLGMDGTGTIEKDLSDNGNDATLVGGVTKEDVEHKAIVTDGLNSYARVNQIELQGEQEIMIAGWVYVPSQQYSVGWKKSHVYGLSKPATAYWHYLALTAANTETITYYNIRGNLWRSSDNTTKVWSYAASLMDQWVHLAWGLSKSTKLAYMYVNGVLVRTTDLTAWLEDGYITPLDENSSGFNIGSNNYDGERFALKAGPTFIFNKILSESEVKTLMSDTAMVSPNYTSDSRGIKTLNDTISGVSRGKKSLTLTKNGLARGLKAYSITKNSIARGVKTLSLSKNSLANGYWPTTVRNITKYSQARGVKELSTTKSGTARGIKVLSISNNAVARGEKLLSLSKSGTARGVKTLSLTKNSLATGYWPKSTNSITKNAIARGIKTLSLTKNGMARALKEYNLTKDSIARGKKTLSITKNGLANGYWPTSVNSLTKDSTARGIKALTLTKDSYARGIKNLSLTIDALSRGIKELSLDKNSVGRGEKQLDLSINANSIGYKTYSTTRQSAARGEKNLSLTINGKANGYWETEEVILYIQSHARGKKSGLSLTKNSMARALLTDSLTKDSNARGIKNLQLTINSIAEGYWPTTTRDIQVDGAARGVKTLSYSTNSLGRGIKNLSLNTNAASRGIKELSLTIDSISRGSKGYELTKNSSARGIKTRELTPSSLARGIKTLQLTKDSLARALKTNSLELESISRGKKVVELTLNGTATGISGTHYIVISGTSRGSKTQALTTNSIAAGYVENDLTISGTSRGKKQLSTTINSVARAIKVNSTAIDSTARGVLSDSLEINSTSRGIKQLSVTIDSQAAGYKEYFLEILSNATGVKVLSLEIESTSRGKKELQLTVNSSAKGTGQMYLEINGTAKGVKVNSIEISGKARGTVTRNYSTSITLVGTKDSAGLSGGKSVNELAGTKQSIVLYG